MDPISDNNLFKLFLSKISNTRNDLSKYSSSYCDECLQDLNTIEKKNQVEFSNKEEILYNFANKSVQDAKDTVERIIKDNNENIPKSKNNFRIFLPSGYYQTMSDIKNFISDLKNKMKANPDFKGTKSSSMTSQEELIELTKSQQTTLSNLSNNIQQLNYNLTRNQNQNTYTNLYSNNQLPINSNYLNDINNEVDFTNNYNEQYNNQYQSTQYNNTNNNPLSGLFILMQAFLNKLNDMQHKFLKMEHRMRHK